MHCSKAGWRSRGLLPAKGQRARPCQLPVLEVEVLAGAARVSRLLANYVCPPGCLSGAPKTGSRQQPHPRLAPHAAAPLPPPSIWTVPGALQRWPPSATKGQPACALHWGACQRAPAAAPAQLAPQAGSAAAAGQSVAWTVDAAMGPQLGMAPRRAPAAGRSQKQTASTSADTGPASE